MQRIDATAIGTYGIPRLLLMEQAGLAVARAVPALLPRSGARVLVCCGTGYNGGDGFAAARHLHAQGFFLRLMLMGRLGALREEPAIFAKIVQRMGLPIIEITSLAVLDRAARHFTRVDLIIDALLGIGLRGAVREPLASLIRHMNASGTPILAVDVPSGLDADTGRVPNIAVRATRTVSFGRAKRGCLRGEGPAYTGSLMIDPIAIPRVLLGDQR